MIPLKGSVPYVTLDHKTSHKSLGYICSNSQKYIVWVKKKNILCKHSLGYWFKIMFHEYILYVSDRKYIYIYIYIKQIGLVICIAKNLIWTTLKMIFSIFRFVMHPQIPDLQIVVQYISQICPIITNHKSMERLFIQLSDDVYISEDFCKNLHLWLVLWSSRVTYVLSAFN